MLRGVQCEKQDHSLKFFLFHRIIILFLLTHLVSFYVLKRLKSQHSIKPDGTCLYVMTYRFVTKVSKFSHLFTF